MLIKHRRGIVRPLLALLNSPDVSRRRQATHVLGAVAPIQDRVGDALVRALHDPDEEVRAFAAWGLGEHVYHNRADALVAGLQDPAKAVRSHAAFALARLGRVE